MLLGTQFLDKPTRTLTLTQRMLSAKYRGSRNSLQGSPQIVGQLIPRRRPADDVNDCEGQDASEQPGEADQERDQEEVHASSFAGASIFLKIEMSVLRSTMGRKRQ